MISVRAYVIYEGVIPLVPETIQYKGFTSGRFVKEIVAAISVPVLGGLFIETILAAKLSPGRPIQLAAKIGPGDPGHFFP